MRLMRAVVACALLVGVVGCSSDAQSDITPMPRAGKVTLDRAVALSEAPAEVLAEEWSQVPGSEPFTPVTDAVTEKSNDVCTYRSTIYQAKGDTSQAQWVRLAGVAQPMMEDIGLDTSKWVDEHAAVGGGLIARGTSGAVFVAQPKGTDDANPDAYDAIRFYIRVPIHDAECE